MVSARKKNMKKLLLVLLFLLLASATEAQTVTNPTRVIFTASADHSTAAAGVNLVDKYILLIYDGTTQVNLVDLGKPVPILNDITVNLTSTGLPKNKALLAYIDTTGPGGTTRSTASNPFVFLGPPAAAGNVRVSQ